MKVRLTPGRLTTKECRVIATGMSDWTGTWKSGSGSFSTSSDVIAQQPYTFETRFGDDVSAGPEELLATAHAACINQALAHNFDRASLQVANIDTRVEVDYGISASDTPSIRGAAIFIRASIPGASEEQLHEIAAKSVHGCTISKILNIPMTFTASLAGTE
jgi:osmotically inducible protein OsmC